MPYDPLNDEIVAKLAPKTEGEAVERGIKSQLMKMSNEDFTHVANAVNWEARRRLKRLKKEKGGRR